jgi:hypothetical protein
VHPTGGSRRVFRQFGRLEAGSGKVALSRPAHPRVTHTVGWLRISTGRKMFMSLREGITLSKKHQKNFGVFPYFFKHALNDFYFLTDECGFLKPKLDIWKNEGAVEFTSKETSILVQYESPGWVNVCFQKTGIPGKIYEYRLFEILGIPFDLNLLKPRQKKYSPEAEQQIREIESDIERITQYVSRIIWDNRDKIFSYLRNTTSLAEINR